MAQSILWLIIDDEETPRQVMVERASLMLRTGKSDAVCALVPTVEQGSLLPSKVVPAVIQQFSFLPGLFGEEGILKKFINHSVILVTDLDLSRSWSEVDAADFNDGNSSAVSALVSTLQLINGASVVCTHSAQIGAVSPLEVILSKRCNDVLPTKRTDETYVDKTNKVGGLATANPLSSRATAANSADHDKVLARALILVTALSDFDYSVIDTFVIILVSRLENHDLGRECIERWPLNIPQHFKALMGLLGLDSSGGELAPKILNAESGGYVLASDGSPNSFDPAYSALKPLCQTGHSFTLLAVFFSIWGGLRNRCVEQGVADSLMCVDTSFMECFNQFKNCGLTGEQCRNDLVFVATNEAQIKEAARLIYFIAWKLSLTKCNSGSNLYSITLDRDCLSLQFVVPSDRIWNFIGKYAGSLSALIQNGFEHLPAISKDGTITATDKELCRAILRMLVMFGTAGEKRRFSFSIDQRGNLLCLEFVRMLAPDPV